MDRHLDTLRKGALYLRQPAIAALVVGSIYKGAEIGHYDLHAYVIMPNHVHLLIQPKVSPKDLMKSLKGVTAREANRILHRTGEPFWQKESCDHWMRDEIECQRIRAYIENNPVKAGLVDTPEEHPWSSAGVEMSPDAAQKSACATYS
jgi:REP element-mobilizing transposase RayT